MRCIFCKQDSSTSKTIEHIIPESLGNKEHTLPAGVVCDDCNNYFSHQVEAPLLNSDYFRDVRSRMWVPSKKGRIPTIQALALPSMVVVELMNDEWGKSICPKNEKDSYKLINSLRTHNSGSLIVPIPVFPDEKTVSRFLGKVAIEVLAFRFLKIESGLDEVIDKPELDQLRKFTRYGTPEVQWPYYKRRIYPEDKKYYEEGYGSFEILHEFNLLYTETNELYLILAIFGIEYGINYGGPEIDGYIDWLKKNDYKSYLYK